MRQCDASLVSCVPRALGCVSSLPGRDAPSLASDTPRRHASRACGPGCLRADAPLVPERCLTSLKELGARVLRAHGIVHYALSTRTRVLSATFSLQARQGESMPFTKQGWREGGREGWREGGWRRVVGGRREGGWRVGGRREEVGGLVRGRWCIRGGGLTDGYVCRADRPDRQAVGPVSHTLGPVAGPAGGREDRTASLLVGLAGRSAGQTSCPASLYL